MKKTVIFIVLLMLITPFSFAKTITVGELFESEKKEEAQEPSSRETSGTTIYFYAGSKLIASKNTEIKYHQQDRLGSDINSKTLPFGQEIYSENRFSFTGKELDDELYYFGARYYNPNIGRFTSIDPVPSEPPYQYVSNNPLNLIDPTGMAPDYEMPNYERQYISQDDMDAGTVARLLVRDERYLNQDHASHILTLQGFDYLWQGEMAEDGARIYYPYTEPEIIDSLVSFGDSGEQQGLSQREFITALGEEFPEGTAEQVESMANFVFSLSADTVGDAYEVGKSISEEDLGAAGSATLALAIPVVPAKATKIAAKGIGRIANKLEDAFVKFGARNIPTRINAEVDYGRGVPRFRLFWERITGTHSNKLR